MLQAQFTAPTNTPAWNNISALFPTQFGFFTHSVLDGSPRTVFSIGTQFRISITSANQLQVNLPGVAAPQLFDNIPADNELHRLGVSLRNGSELVVYIDCLEGRPVTLPSTVGPLMVGATTMAVVGGPATVSAGTLFLITPTLKVILFSLRLTKCCWTQVPSVD